MIKHHYCRGCGGATPYDGVNRPIFCTSCGMKQTVSAYAPQVRQPTHILTEEEDAPDLGDYDIEALASALELRNPTQPATKFGQNIGQGDLGGGELFKREPISKKAFKSYVKNMDAKIEINRD